jgi:hypothetical protein
VVESRRSRRRCLQQARPHLWRGVPLDLRGKCFNCFSVLHRAAECRRLTRCFRCLEPGHRSSGCPRRLATSNPRSSRCPSRRPGPVPSGRPPAAASHPPAAAGRPASASMSAGPSAPPGRRPRRRPRHLAAPGAPASPSSSDGVSDDGPPEHDPTAIHVGERPPTRPIGSRPKPFCVLRRSEAIDLAEAELRRMLLVYAGGAHPTVQPQRVVELVARTFNMDQAAMTIATSAPEDFLLFLPSGASVNRVFNRGEPLHGPAFSLFFKRWTRLVQAEAAALSVQVDVKLQGVPAYAWSLAMVQQLLAGSCWVHSLHPDAAARRDMSVL